MHTLKHLALGMAWHSGCARLVLNSRWRRQRLLVLCYHGTSIADEHEWDPQLYMAPARLRRRLELIRETGCAVLPFAEAVTRLYAGDLPPRAVTVTYDDGAYDFYAQAVPLLREFDIPATVYLTTYYVTHPTPVFDSMSSYLLWKAGPAATLEWPEIAGSAAIRLDQTGRLDARRRLQEFAARERLTGGEKSTLLEQLAARIGVDYRALLDRRLLQLMTVDEARRLAQQGVDIQLHTHRHAMSTRKDLFAREIQDNRAVVEPLRGGSATHFCYPSGAYRSEFVGWLREWRVDSATTCDPGLVSRHTEPLCMPRFVDTSDKSEAEFGAWLTGLAALLPTRSYADTPARMLE